MKSSGNTAQDPDFNDELPGVKEGSFSADPDATEFRDALQVGSYASVGALQTEVERERQEAEQATLNVLEAMRAMDAGDQVKWRISRTGHEDDTLNGYLETWPNHLMTIERLRDRFGGGTYYCKGFRRGKYCAHETLQISGEAKRKPSGVEGVSQSVPVNSTPAFDIQGFLIAQERRDEKRRDEERRERQEREEREEKRRQERMQLLLTLGPAAISALGGLFTGRPDNTAALITALKPPDPLTMLAQLKALQGGGQEGVLSKVLPMLIDMAGSRASGGDTGWLDVLKEFAKGAGPAVGGLIEAQVAAARAGTAAPALSGPISASVPMTAPESLPALTSPAPTQSALIVVPESVPRKERRTRTARESSAAELPPPSAPMGASAAPIAGSSSLSEIRAVPGAKPPAGQVDMNYLTLMQYLPWLREMLVRMLNAAARGKDPEVYAALFLEELPEGIDLNVVGQLLASEDWPARLMQIEPRWNDERVFPWLHAVRDLILRSLSQEGAPQGVHFAQHAPARPSTSERASVEVDVRGPGAAHSPGVSQAARPVPEPTPPVIDRPTKLPSLTGD